MKIALDPTPFHRTHELLEFPQLVADLGYEYLQLTPHKDFIPFFNHPKADGDLVHKFRKACAAAGVGIASVLPVLRWSGPDEDAREAAVRYWKRAIQNDRRSRRERDKHRVQRPPREGGGIGAGVLPLDGRAGSDHRTRRHRRSNRSAPRRFRGTVSLPSE